MGFSFLTDIFHTNIRQKKPHDTSPPIAQKSFGNCMPGFLMTRSRAEGLVEDILVKSEVRYSWSHSLANQRGFSPPQSSSPMSPEKSKSLKRQNTMDDTGQQFCWCPQFLPAVVPPAWSPQSHQVKAAPSSPKPSALMVNVQRYVMQSSPSTNWGTVPTLRRPSDRQTVLHPHSPSSSLTTGPVNVSTATDSSNTRWRWRNISWTRGSSFSL